MFVRFFACAWLSSSFALTPNPDWLVDGQQYKSKLDQSDPEVIRLYNGLVSRIFKVKPDFATIGYDEHHTSKSSIFRALSPEAVVYLNGTGFNVGGVLSSVNRAYFNRTAFNEDVRQNNNSFHFSHVEVGLPVAPFPYSPTRNVPKDVVWPPKGIRIDVSFKAPDWAHAFRDVIIVVHYEIYDNIPTIKKWVSVSAGSKPLAVMFSSIEQLAVNQPWARLNPNADSDAKPGPEREEGFYWLYVEATWPHDTQISWSVEAGEKDTPGSLQPLLNVTYKVPYHIPVLPGETLDSFGVVETAVGSSDPDRATLTRNRALRTILPQIQENPIYFHMVNSDSTSVRTLIDQMAEVGFEMLVYSFKSNVNMESTNDTFIKQIMADVSYARSKEIEVGSYDMIVWTRSCPEQYRAVTETGQITHNSCIASGWYEHLHSSMIGFMKATGMTSVETDGPYPGYTCSSHNHSHHSGVTDSVYRQVEKQGQLFFEFRKNGFYITQPDNYFYFGANKKPMGYDEHQYSLPRRQDLSLSRQGMYDDLRWMPPTMGFMFVPLTVYHGGGSAATFEPLSDNADDYEFALAQYFGAGVISNWRGFRLYDSEETKAIVKKWVSFYKRYREILISDLIHIKRPDMQGLDGFVHVNPNLSVKALSMVYNPTDTVQSMNWTVPLYYAGFGDSSSVRVSVEGSTPQLFALDRWVQAHVYVSLRARSVTWMTFL